MRLNATSLLFLEAIVYSKNIGMNRLDFGVSRPGTGVWHYKQGWCPQKPEEVLYMYKVRNGDIIDPRASRIVKYSNYWKKLPRWIANSVGPWIRGQIGK